MLPRLLLTTGFQGATETKLLVVSYLSFTRHWHPHIINPTKLYPYPSKFYKCQVEQISDPNMTDVPVFKLSFVYVPINKRSFVLMCKQEC